MSTNPEPGDTLRRVAALRSGGDAAAALELVEALAAEFPADVHVAYQAAWTHDVLGLEAGALPHYERALSRPGLGDDDRRGALLGWGSTLRTLGRHRDAERVLARGVREFPGDQALHVFHAMAAYNTGDGKGAAEELLRVLLATTADEDIIRYRQAIELYADDLDRVWTGEQD